MIISISWRWFIPYLIISIILSVIPAASIWVGKLILDNIVEIFQKLPSASLHTVYLLVALEVGLLLLQLTFNQVVSIISIKMWGEVDIKLHQDLLTISKDIRFQYFEYPKFHDQLSMITQYFLPNATSYVSNAVGLLRSVTYIISISAILLRVDPWFLVAILGLNLVNFFISINMTNYQVNHESERINNNRYIRYLFDLMTKIETIRDLKLFNLYPTFMKKYKERRKNELSAQQAIAKKLSIISLVKEWLSTSLYYGFYIYIILLVAKQRLTVGDIALYQRSYQALNGSISGLMNLFTSIYNSNLYVNSYFEFASLASAHQSSSNHELRAIKKISLRDVNFAYHNNDKHVVLSDCSCEFNAGCSYALIGKNGSGKSTLLKMLCGLYKVSSGEILINSLSIDNYSLTTYQKQISSILQNFTLYQMSVRDNVLLGDASQSQDMAALEASFNAAQLDEVIRKLPVHEETILSRSLEDGVLLSKGEEQKTALARALYRKASVYIFDEPDAHVDQTFLASLKAIYNSLKAQGCIVIVATHHFSTLEDFDSVVYIDDGLISQGRHEDLLKVNDNYYQLTYS